MYPPSTCFCPWAGDFLPYFLKNKTCCPRPCSMSCTCGSCCWCTSSLSLTVSCIVSPFSDIGSSLCGQPMSGRRRSLPQQQIRQGHYHLMWKAELDWLPRQLGRAGACTGCIRSLLLRCFWWYTHRTQCLYKLFHQTFESSHPNCKRKWWAPCTNQRRFALSHPAEPNPSIYISPSRILRMWNVQIRGPRLEKDTRHWKQRPANIYI